MNWDIAIRAFISIANQMYVLIFNVYSVLIQLLLCFSKFLLTTNDPKNLSDDLTSKYCYRHVSKR